MIDPDGRRATRGTITYANVVSTIALVAALGLGSAYAADKIRSNDIAKNAVRSKHIKNGGVRPADLADAARKPDVTVRSAYSNGNPVVAKCNAGEVAVGGGVTGDGPTDLSTGSQPDPNTGTPTGWYGQLRKAGNTTGTGTVYVVCAR